MYLHRCPLTRDVVYVGKGCYGRAWDVTRNRTGHPEHVEWMKELSVNFGFVPNDWVEILRRQLDEKDALTVEKNWLHTNGCPRFNRQSGERNYQAKLTDDQARSIYKRAKENHGKLAEEFNVSRSCISMIASRKQWKAATACLV